MTGNRFKGPPPGARAEWVFAGARTRWISAEQTLQALANLTIIGDPLDLEVIEAAAARWRLNATGESRRLDGPELTPAELETIGRLIADRINEVFDCKSDAEFIRLWCREMQIVRACVELEAMEGPTS